MGKLLFWAVGVIASLASTYFLIAAIIFTLAGGWKNHAAGQRAVQSAADAAHAFVTTAGPSFVDLLQTLGSLVTSLVS